MFLAEGRRGVRRVEEIDVFSAPAAEVAGTVRADLLRRDAGLQEKHEPPQLLALDLRVHVVPRLGEQFLAQLVEIEACPRPEGRLAALAPDHTPHPLGGQGVGVVLHLHQDEAPISPIFRILLQHRMRRRARTGEGVEHDGVPVRGNLEDSLDELHRFGGDKLSGEVHEAV
jgi:hypothetical protein